jgi:hypothetical protein
MFILQTVPRSSLQLSNLEIEPLAVDTGSVKFDLLLSLVHRNDGTSGTLEFNTDPSIAKRSSASRNFASLAEALVRDPTRRSTTYRCSATRCVTKSRPPQRHDPRLPTRTLPEILLDCAQSRRMRRR